MFLPATSLKCVDVSYFACGLCGYFACGLCSYFACGLCGYFVCGLCGYFACVNSNTWGKEIHKGMANTKQTVAIVQSKFTSAAPPPEAFISSWRQLQLSFWTNQSKCQPTAATALQPAAAVSLAKARERSEQKPQLFLEL